MAVYKDRVIVETLADKPTYTDVTDEVRAIVAASGIKEGIVCCISQHTTCAVFTEEYDHDHTPAGDTFLQADLNEGLDSVFPEQHDWKYYRYPGIKHFEEVETWLYGDYATLADRSEISLAARPETPEPPAPAQLSLFS